MLSWVGTDSIGGASSIDTTAKSKLPRLFDSPYDAKILYSPSESHRLLGKIIAV